MCSSARAMLDGALGGGIEQVAEVVRLQRQLVPARGSQVGTAHEEDG
jgi:hypothetical protein